MFIYNPGGVANYWVEQRLYNYTRLIIRELKNDTNINDKK